MENELTDEDVTEPKEPLRWRMVPMVVLGGLIVFLSSWGNGLDWRASLGIAASSMIPSFGGMEWARRNVYSPRSVKGEIDLAFLEGIQARD